MPGALAFRYARALAHLVERPAAAIDAERAMRELQAFESALEASPDLRNALQSPAVPPHRKRGIVARLAKLLPLSDVVRRFLLVVVDHRRVGLIPDVGDAFELVMDERLGVVRADVASARELSGSQRQELIDSLSRLTGKRARARFSIDSRLIGGVVARIGSTVYDGSVRGQLRALKQKMAGVEG